MAGKRFCPDANSAIHRACQGNVTIRRVRSDFMATVPKLQDQDVIIKPRTLRIEHEAPATRFSA
jgi:SepF-like predicted cell division protein (DUF552 family)